MRPAKRCFASDSIAGSEFVLEIEIRQAALGKTHSQAALGNDKDDDRGLIFSVLRLHSLQVLVAAAGQVD